MQIELSGGLGNQMFQYAFFRSMKHLKREQKHLEVKCDYSICENLDTHNGYELKRIFAIDDCEKVPNFTSAMIKYGKLVAIMRKLNVPIVRIFNEILELTIGYYPEKMRFSSNKLIYNGYWQSEEYFQEIKDEIKTCFTFPPFEEEKNLALMGEIRGKNSVSIHVRRGDFLHFSQYINLAATNYYQNAVAYMKAHVDTPVFIVFSDDIQWCKDTLFTMEDVRFVDWNNGKKNFRDMQLMTCCNHNIIANSSFSWWGAWLNHNPSKIVIAPDRFYQGRGYDDSHIVPKSWHKIEVQND